MCKSNNNNSRLAYFTFFFNYCLFILSTCYASVSTAADVLVVVPDESLYWSSVYEPMVPVAEQLDIELSVLRPKSIEGMNFVPELSEYLANNTKPDWVVWVARRTSPSEMLDLLEKHEIRSINISNPITELQETGLPQQKYTYWEAEITSSNFRATYNMLSEVVKSAPNFGLTPPYSLIGIAGVQYLKSAQKVTAAVKTASDEIPTLNLIQLIHSKWNRESSYQKTLALLSRHNRSMSQTQFGASSAIDLIWTGNIDLALGAVEAVEAYSAGSEVPAPLVIGQGWHPSIFDQIAKGNIAMSVGGNHLHGLWALAMIYDHEQGNTLDTSPWDRVIVVEKYIASKDNVAQLTNIFDTDYWQSADIKQYTKTANEALSHYDFDVGLLVSKDEN
ncbi:hypothetical protein KUL49_34430 [Alteromonas sp. KUL49]|nr:hypothetical protein KUL49_34430 [Alteromonas sp. KUL49]